MSLFITYVNKPFTIIERHLPDGYAYADDTRLYLSFKPDRKQDQAAALGTSLFITYVNKLSTIIERHLPDGCAYADDTQLHNTCRLSPTESKIKPLPWVRVFITYVSKLCTIIERHLPDGYAYADDTQLYLWFKPGQKQDQAASLNAKLY